MERARVAEEAAAEELNGEALQGVRYFSYRARDAREPCGPLQRNAQGSSSEDGVLLLNPPDGPSEFPPPQWISTVAFRCKSTELNGFCVCPPIFCRFFIFLVGVKSLVISTNDLSTPRTKKKEKEKKSSTGNPFSLLWCLPFSFEVKIWSR